MKKFLARMVVVLASAWTFILGILLALVLVPLCLIPRTGNVRSKIAWTYARWLWAPIVSFLVGVKYEPRGLEHIPKEHVIFAANHESFFDIFAFLGVFEYAKFVAKMEMKSLLGGPVAWGATGANQCFIDRSDGPGAIAGMIDHVTAYPNASYIVFCQGTRSSREEKKKFKHGAATLALAVRYAIMPVAISGGRKILERGWMNFERGGRIIIEFCEPISVTRIISDEAHSQELISQVEGVVRAKLKEHEQIPFGTLSCRSYWASQCNCPQRKRA